MGPIIYTKLGPIRTFLPEKVDTNIADHRLHLPYCKIYWNSSCDWLIGSFLFGTEIGEGQLNKSPCISMKYIKNREIEIEFINIGRGNQVTLLEY